MRALRIAPARQLALFTDPAGPAGGWDGLPEQCRAQVLALLARMIARGVLAGVDLPDARPGAGAADGD
jgi:hypothetical protein